MRPPTVYSYCTKGWFVTSDRSLDFFRRDLTREEITSRYNIYLERYVKTLEIELETTGQMVVEYVVPAVERQLHRHTTTPEVAISLT